MALLHLAQPYTIAESYTYYTGNFKNENADGMLTALGGEISMYVTKPGTSLVSIYLKSARLLHLATTSLPTEKSHTRNYFEFGLRIGYRW